MTWAVPAIAGLLIAFAAVSGRIDGTPITAPIVFTLGGLALGVAGSDLIELDYAGEAVKLLAELTLGLVLFVDASRIDFAALRRQLALPVRLLAIGLPGTIALGTVAALVIFDEFSLPEAILLAVVLAPTDAALGKAVVTLPSLPTVVRQGLNVESGLNDGICVPIFLVVLAIAHTESGTIGGGAAAVLVFEQIGYGVAAGIVTGAVAGTVLVIAGRRKSIDPLWVQIVPVAAAAFAYTAAVGVGGSGFIAAFVGGLAFGVIRRRAGGDVSYLIEEFGDLSSGVTFIVYGAVLLGPALGNLSWAVLGYAVVSLTVVRMLPAALAMIGLHARAPTVGFVGWFGPRGLATIVFVILIVEEPHELPHESLLLTTSVITIGLSVVAHGLTAAPLAGRYSRWYRSSSQRT